MCIMYITQDDDDADDDDDNDADDDDDDNNACFYTLNSPSLLIVGDAREFCVVSDIRIRVVSFDFLGFFFPTRRARVFMFLVNVGIRV